MLIDQVDILSSTVIPKLDAIPINGIETTFRIEKKKRQVEWFNRTEMNFGPFCKVLSSVLLA